MIQINKIKGYENVQDIYFINKDGHVYSEKIGGYLKECSNGHGYMNVSLKLKGEKKYKHAYVHRLTAMAYVANPHGKSEVNHIDENAGNNRADNLEWVTHLENNRYGTKNERMVRTRCFDVFVYDVTFSFIGKYIGMNKATLSTIGYSDTKGIDRRIKNFFYLSLPLESFPKDKLIDIANNSQYKTVVVENIKTNEKLFFDTNRDARRFFNDKVNVTDAIKHKWLVRKSYRLYNLDYAKLIDSPILQK